MWSQVTRFEQKGGRDLLFSEKFKLHLESYCRLVFHELIRLEITADLTPRRFIKAFNFWQVRAAFHQYSKLPKLVSDRLFSVFERESRWSCTDFITCFYTLLNQSDPLSLIFKMADFGGSGIVYLEDLKCLLKHSLAHISQESSREELYSGIQMAFKQLSELPAIIKFQFPQFRAFSLKTSLCQSIFYFLLSSLNIVEKVQNYTNLNLQLDAPLQNATFSNRINSTPECMTEEDEQQVQNKPKLTKPLICEGVMYRLIEGKGLKPYYYKLTNTELFAFRKPEDRNYKCVVYYGHDSYLNGFKTHLETSKNHGEVYCLEAGSSAKRTQYFVTSLEDYKRWKDCLFQVMGLPGLFSEDFEIQKKIGEGQFGTVSRATNLRSGKIVAIKAIQKSKLSLTTSQLLRQEIEIHKMCRHPNLVKLYNVYEDEENVYLEMEYVKGGSLSHFVSKLKSVSHWVIIGVLHQVAKALQFLKGLSIMHRDIKCSNIILTGRFIKYRDASTAQVFDIPEVKLADYGLSTIIQSNQKPSLFCGTTAYMAPEVFLPNGYDYPADVYSLGVVAYYLSNYALPFSSDDIETYKKLLVHQEPNFDLDSFLRLPRYLRGLIQRMLSKRPKKRPSLAEIMKPGMAIFETGVEH